MIRLPKHLFDLQKNSIKIVQMHYDENKPYIVGFSGGKDSVVLYDIVKRAKVPINRIEYNNTTIDPPGLISFIMKNYPDVLINQPERSFYQLIEKYRLPTAQRRFCCGYLKESNEANVKIITGVRQEESTARTKRYSGMEFEYCMGKGRTHVTPIKLWTEKDIWDYIHFYSLQYPKKHYDENNRLGCIGCPLVNDKERIKQFQKYPKVAKRIIQAIREKRKDGRGNAIEILFKNEYEVFWWWIHYRETSMKHHIHRRDTGLFSIDYKKELEKLLKIDL